MGKRVPYPYVLLDLRGGVDGILIRRPILI